MYINNKQKNKLFALMTMCFSIVLGLVLLSYPLESSYFPRFLTLFLFCMGVILFIRTLNNKEEDKANDKAKAEQTKTFKSGALIFISLVLYVIALQNIDYSISTVIFLSVMMYILGFRNLIYNILISVGFYGALYLIFFHFLGISAP